MGLRRMPLTAGASFGGVTICTLLLVGTKAPSMDSGSWTMLLSYKLEERSS